MKAVSQVLDIYGVGVFLNCTADLCARLARSVSTGFGVNRGQRERLCALLFNIYRGVGVKEVYEKRETKTIDQDLRVWLLNQLRFERDGDHRVSVLGRIRERIKFRVNV